MKDHRLLDGRAVRDRILDEVAERVRQASATHTIGRLVSVSIGAHKAAAVYVRAQANAARKVGLRFEDQTWPATLTQEECKARLVAMNDDPDVLGVILQRPVPTHINGRSLASKIHPFKDIEGMNPASIGDIVYNDLTLAPCTAAASVELIKATGLTLHGLEVVMVGHSEIVGKPAASCLPCAVMALRMNMATVTGPTPPGTGVTQLATSLTLSVSTSPTIIVDPSGAVT